MEAIRVVMEVCPADAVVCLGSACREWAGVGARHRLDFRGSRWDGGAQGLGAGWASRGRGKGQEREREAFRRTVGWARGALRELVLPRAMARRLGAEAIVEAVEGNAQLRVLSIAAGTGAGDDAVLRSGIELTWAQLARVLRACPHMQQMDVGLNASAVAAAAAAAAAGDGDGNGPGRDDSAACARRAISILADAAGREGHRAPRHGCGAVRFCSLNLRDVPLSTDLALLLIDGVLANPGLAQLDVRGCGIGVYTGACLMQAWACEGGEGASCTEGGTAPRRAAARTLSNLRITDDRLALHTMRVLADDPTLVDLQMDGEAAASVGDLGALAAALAQNTTVCRVSLGGCHLDDHGAAELAQGLLENDTVEALELERNSIGNAGAVSLARLLAPWGAAFPSPAAGGRGAGPPLRRLGLGHNDIQEAGVLHLARALMQNDTLRDLDLRGNRFGAGGARFIATLLVQTAALASLVISENPIGDEGGIVIARALASNHFLRHVDLSACGIGDRSVLELAQGLRWAGAASALSEFSARGNGISGYGARELARALHACPNLRALDLSENELGGDGAGALIVSALTGSGVEVLALAGNHVGDEGMACLAERLSAGGALPPAPSPLRRLDLGSNGLGSVGVRSLAALLTSGSLACLKSLSVGGNAFGPEGARVLGEALRRTSTHLTELNVDGCALGDQGCVHLVGALKGGGLRCLHVGNNHIGDVGAVALCECLLTGDGAMLLEDLHLCDNLVTHEGALRLADALKRTARVGGRGLRRLNCSRNRLGDIGAAAIADAILLGCGLEELHLASNDVGNVGAQGLARALASESVGLVHLDLGENRISEIGAQVLAGALCGNISLSSLNFSDNCLFDWGAREMSNLLLTNSAITSLSLDGNGIGSREAAAIRVAWTGSPTRRGETLSL